MNGPRQNIQPGASRPRPLGSLLTDGVIDLRPLAVVDAAQLLAGRDDELIRWLNSGPETLQGARAWLGRREEYWLLGGPVFAFGIRHVRSETLLGTVELRIDETYLEPGQAAISYGLYPLARRRGIAVRACRLGCAFAARAFTTGPRALREVVAHIDPFNAGSLRVARRAGFQHVDSCVRAGAAWELFVIDLTRQQFPSTLAG